MTVLGDKLQKALNANNVNNYVWKGPKNANGIQEEIKLINCSYNDRIIKWRRSLGTNEVFDHLMSNPDSLCAFFYYFTKNAP